MAEDFPIFFLISQPPSFSLTMCSSQSLLLEAAAPGTNVLPSPLATRPCKLPSMKNLKNNNNRQ